MSWDPDKRPNAQQTQRYQYFQNIKLNNSGQNRPNQILPQNNSVSSGRMSIMDVDALESSGLLNRFSLNSKLNNSNEMNDLNSLISVSRLSHNPCDKQIINNEKKNQDHAAKSYLKFQNNLNFSILNDMFSNIGVKSEKPENDNKSNISVSNKSNENSDMGKDAHEKEQLEAKNSKTEKVNDVYINLAKESTEGLFQSKVPNDKSLAKNTGFVYNSKGFFLHEPKPLINAKSISENNLNDSNKIYNMFSKQSNNGSFDDGLLDVLNAPKSKLYDKSGSFEKGQWKESFEDDELASILG